MSWSFRSFTRISSKQAANPSLVRDKGQLSPWAGKKRVWKSEDLGDKGRLSSRNRQERTRSPAFLGDKAALSPRKAGERVRSCRFLDDNRPLSPRSSDFQTRFLPAHGDNWPLSRTKDGLAACLLEIRVNERKDHDMKKAKLRVTRLTHPDLIQQAIGMKQAILKNAALFPEIAAMVPELDAFLSPFVAARQDIGRMKAELRVLESTSKSCRKALEVRMSRMADYLSGIANGNVGMILAAGVPATNDRRPVIMTKVYSLRVTPGINE